MRSTPAIHASENADTRCNEGEPGSLPGMTSQQHGLAARASGNACALDTSAGAAGEGSRGSRGSRESDDGRIRQRVGDRGQARRLAVLPRLVRWISGTLVSSIS